MGVNAVVRAVIYPCNGLIIGEFRRFNPPPPALITIWGSTPEPFRVVLKAEVLVHTKLAKAQPATVIPKLFKIAVRVVQYKDRIKLHLPGSCPVKHLLTLYTRGFDGFVASTTAPIATGRSDNCRVGLSPTERPCLGTAH